METFIVKNTWLHSDIWWGNWYVTIPKTHPLYWVKYNDIDDIDIHWWLTYWDFVSEQWANRVWIDKSLVWKFVLWFDTSHFWDTSEKWTKEKVQEEANSLLEQVKNYKNKYATSHFTGL